MKQNKIIIISSEFPPLPGGIGNHAYCLAFELFKNAKEVKVITDVRADKEEDELVFDLDLPFEVKRISKFKIRIFTYLIRIYYALIEAFSSNRRTFILSGKFSIWIGGLMKFIRPNHKYIAVVHGSEINAGGKFAKKYTAWCLSKFTKVIAVSKFTKNLILENKTIEDIVVINNGFSSLNENEFLLNRRKNTDELNIITVGNVTFRKGQNNVISALPAIKKVFPNVQYHIVGIPTEKATFKTLANELGVKENITFHGAITDIELKEIMIQADVFFMLSNVLENGDVEGFGIAVLEANAFGIPAIGSKNSGIADAIKNKYSGQLVDPKNEIEIVDSLIDIMNDFEEYSNNAIKWSKQFSWEIVIKKYLEIID
jgi:phosphatidylinositol alpha-1,6-mannosyltransferase